MDIDGVSELEQMIVKIRDMSQGSSPEDTMRKLVANKEQFAAPAVIDSMNRLLQLLDDDPEIDVSFWSLSVRCGCDLLTRDGPK